jgi:hypothetical protein
MADDDRPYMATACDAFIAHVNNEEKRIMIADELTYMIAEKLGFEPTAEQLSAMRTFAAFMTDRSDRVLMIMRGSAGTGKTSVAGAMVRTMKQLGCKVVLMAPTGRAAKVFALNAGHAACTIHRRIYRQRSLGGGFSLAPNMLSDTLFMIDEASMIANAGSMDSLFAGGRLLDDLTSFVYGGRNCRMILIGDRAQLPPVGEEESPALSAAFMEGYGLKVYESDLNEVVRQDSMSGILFNATAIRSLITRDRLTLMPKVKFSGFADVVMVNGSELIESLASSYSEVGMDETMVVTRSNKRANIYNQGIRNTVLGREEMLTTGDMIMVVRNNYYWAGKDAPTDAGIKKDAAKKADRGESDTTDTATTGISFLANGDRAVVQRVRNVRELYGFNFADLWLQLPDYDNYELQATVITDSLMTEAPALTREQNNRLFENVMEDYSDIRLKTDRIKKIKENPYFNALQIKFAYAVTCHKAQGGQWAHVYLDQGYMTDDMLTPEYIHWLYTAFTRATEKLFLVNWPKTQTADN